MKKTVLGVTALALVTLLGGCAPKEVELFYSEDILQQGFINNQRVSYIGDPYLVVEDGTYYVTATGDGRSYDIYSCDDLMTWKKETKIFSSSSKEGWVRSSLWQPQIVKGNDGHFYLYYCGNNDMGSLRIGVAVADAITGPYKDVYDHPLFDFGAATIDPYFYVDDDGAMYLYFSRDCSENIVDGYKTSQLYGIEMAGYTEVKEGAKPQLLVTPDQGWELQNGDYRWNEGPDILKHDGKYYLFYSGGFYGDKTYSIGYAVADAPLGPYVKYENNPVIASTEDTSGPGNNSFFYSADGKEFYNCYHTHSIKSIGGGNRKVTIDLCGFREDGTFFMNGPTTDYQTPVSGQTDLTKIETIASVEAQGTLEGLDPKTILDGETLNSKNQGLYEWRTDNSEGAGVTINLTEKTALDCIYIYGSKEEKYSPASVEVLFDDGRISSVTIPAGSERPTVLYFNRLETSKVQIRVTGYGEAEGLGLSEVILYRKGE